MAINVYCVVFDLLVKNELKLYHNFELAGKIENMKNNAPSSCSGISGIENSEKSHLL